jgi:hypothetical protein
MILNVRASCPGHLAKNISYLGFNSTRNFTQALANLYCEKCIFLPFEIKPSSGSLKVNNFTWLEFTPTLNNCDATELAAP